MNRWIEKKAWQFGQAYVNLATEPAHKKKKKKVGKEKETNPYTAVMKSKPFF